MPPNHLILCHPLFLLPTIFPSIRVFSNELVHHIRWSKYWSFTFTINPFSEYSGLISFRMAWLDLLAVQGSLNETCILSRVKQITSQGWMHETSAWTWCTGKTQRDRVEREVGGASGWGIHVNPWLIHVNV